MAVRKKRSISIPPELDAAIEAAAAEAGMTYSAWLADTARKEFAVRAGLAAVAEYERARRLHRRGARRGRRVGEVGGVPIKAIREPPTPLSLMGVTYDTGALVAADRGERRMWARHRALLARRELPTVPAPVVAQGWRGGSRQALLARLLVGCDVETLDDDRARAVGALAARAGTPDVVDACAVEGALRRHDLVITSDPDDLKGIATVVGQRLEVDRP